MLLLEKTFKIEVTTDEIDIITDALHSYRNDIIKTAKKEETTDKGRLIEKGNKIRDIRNGFASLINRQYMGQDS